ncbi:MAG: CarD family transcriptional regulator [Pseudomonadota bacterium]
MPTPKNNNTKTSNDAKTAPKTTRTASSERRKPAAKTAAKSATKSQNTTKTAAKPATAKAAPAAKKTATKTKAKAPAKAAAKPKPEAKTTTKAAEKKTAKTSAKPAAKKKTAKRQLDFKVNDHIVYPAHGVGKITGVEEQEIAGLKVELFVIEFEHEKMKLRVPTAKAKAGGMRPLATEDAVKNAMETLKGRARIKRTMWSRRAQEYESKINSGNLISIAEVVRDLYRSDEQPEQSYSERQLYESALERMAREVAAVQNIDDAEAISRLEASLQKNAA